MCGPIVGRNAFETAVEVISDGYEGQYALTEWMYRIDQLGQRYCALAIDLIFQQASVGQFEAEAAPATVMPEQVSFEPLFEGMFSFDGVPGEPVTY